MMIRERLSLLHLRRMKLILFLPRTHPSATSSSKSPYIAKAGECRPSRRFAPRLISLSPAPFFNILSLPSTKEHLEAFNDLALQWAPSERIEQKSASFWDELDEAAEPNEWEREVGKAANKVEDEKKRALDRIQNDLVAALSRATLE